MIFPPADDRQPRGPEWGGTFARGVAVWQRGGDSPARPPRGGRECPRRPGQVRLTGFATAALIMIVINAESDSQRSCLGSTCLHAAAAAGSSQCLAYILDAGGDHLLEEKDIGVRSLSLSPPPLSLSLLPLSFLFLSLRDGGQSVPGCRGGSPS
jgi:hypothetical protein